MRRTSISTCVFLAILPILVLYAHNAAQLHPRQLVQPVLIAAAAALLLTALLTVWLRNGAVASLIAGIVCFTFQALGATTQVLASTGMQLLPARWFASALLVVVTGLLVGAIRVVARQPRRQAPLIRWGLSVSILFVLVQLGRIAVVELGSRQMRAAPLVDSAGSGQVPVDVNLPDIYFIMLDGYGSSDVLREMYGFDNSAFLQALVDSGFHVAQRSQANYVGTLWALASILNMDYVHNLLEVDPSLRQMNPLIRLVRSNRVVHLLRARGYQVITLSSGYGVAEFSKPDLYLEMPQGRDDFEQMLLDTTPLGFWWTDAFDAHRMHRQRLAWSFKALTEVPESAQPRFVFAHILAPHPPFVLDAEGKPQRTPEVFALNDGSDFYQWGRTRHDYLSGYAEQARWVTDQVQQSVRQLIGTPERPPVIILMSDHGPGADLDWESSEKSDLVERFGILHALFLPGAEGMQLQDDLSPTATFRLVFDAYLGGQFGPLPPRSYFCARSRPYDFEDITELLSTAP